MNKLSEQEQRVINEVVTHSFKYVNSNCQKGGVRVCPDQKLSGPYISSLHLIGTVQILADYQTNSGVKPITIAIKDLTGRENSTNPVYKDAYLHALSSPYESDTPSLDPRLRQLLMPVNFGHCNEYISLTPLPCADLSRKFNQSIRNNNKNRNETSNKYLRLSELGFGGANKQNAGYLISIGGLLNQLYTSAPKASVDKKKLYRLFYKGLEPFIPNDAVKAFAAFREKNPGNNLALREKENRLIKNMVSPLLQEADLALSSLAEHSDSLPEPAQEPNELLHSNVDDFKRKLIVSELRDNAWKSQFASTMAKTINAKLQMVEAPSVAGLKERIEGIVTL
ncbi:type I-F CRISPR-associated protein Csy1 [Hydrogenovibrio halophilus]|uniref:type I-F CRISPR-associated protein Csy1 n=1 Tax=Hydrogenovibrio halophilus TaxID=373391 RepID=UPI0003766925|nr:type I-F CRISPR-associated protein Csy1 [Hydrogenovibrio halophilus]